VVEPAGVEPASECALTGASPGAGSFKKFPYPTASAKTSGSVASLCMACSKLCALTFTTNRRPLPDRGTSEADDRVKPRLEQFYCCSLIYKVAHFKDGRRIRPLILPPHPRRNRYGPGMKKQSFATVLRD